MRKHATQMNHDAQLNGNIHPVVGRLIQSLPAPRLQHIIAGHYPQRLEKESAAEVAEVTEV